MRFIDTYSDKEYSLLDLFNDYKEFAKEDPLNHANNFKAELFEILMATINGRNDFEIIGMTAKETNNYVLSLRSELMN